jgi:CheY-like chemotaxis protein
MNKAPILIIEDDQDDQDILRDIMNELKVEHPLVFFADCDKAYSHLMSLEKKPFLILCDINLPRVDGIELKQRIDSTDILRRKAIPFIFLTTSDTQSIVDNAYRITNLQGYFQKSPTMARLKKKIACIIEYWSEALHPANEN